MESDALPPHTQSEAQKYGRRSGLVAMAWASVFFFLAPDLEPVPYWTLFVSVTLLIVLVPAWISGYRAGRDHRRSQESDGGDS